MQAFSVEDSQLLVFEFNSASIKTTCWQNLKSLVSSGNVGKIIFVQSWMLQEISRETSVTTKSSHVSVVSNSRYIIWN